MNKTDKICVIGAKGMLGHAVMNELAKRGYTDVLGVDKDDFDLRDFSATRSFFMRERPQGVFFLAAVAAGINFKKAHPVEMLLDNLQMVTNVLSSAHECGVRKLINICSALVYPRSAQIPLREEDAVSVDLDNVDTPYALSKGVGIKLCQYYRQEYGDQFVSAVPCNFFGEFAPFTGDRAGVVPALIDRIHRARRDGAGQTVVWGTGNACRELLNSKDVASACVYLYENEVDHDFINIGRGEEYSIRQVAETIRRVVGYEGELVFDATKPEGRPHMQLKVDRLFAMGWRPSMDLEQSIQDAYRWYLENY